MLNNTALYGFLITNTISYQFLHIILIILEYYVTIFPNVLSAAKKVSKPIDVKYEYSEMESYFLVFQRIKDAVGINAGSITSIYCEVFIITAIVFLFIYLLLSFFYKQKFRFDFWLKVLVNFLNIGFFRYFSFFYIDILVYCFLTFTLKEGYINGLYSYLFFLLQGVYFFSIFSCISYYSVYIKIANKDIIKSQMNYPFDSYSSSYEKHMMIFKFLVALENNYTFLTGDKISRVSSFLNVAILLYSFYLEVSMVLKNIFLNINLVLIYTNFPLNLIRKFITSFNFSYVVLSLFIPNQDMLVFQVVMIIISLLFGISITYVIWKVIETPRIYNFKDEVKEEVVVYLMSKSFTLGTKAIKNDNLSFYETLMSIVQTNHLIYCPDPSHCVICEKINDLTVSVYDKLYFLYKYNLKNKDQEKKKKQQTYHQYLIKLFYSKIRNKTYKFYKYYYYLLQNKRLKVPILIKNTICFLVMDTMELENEAGNIFLRVLIDLSKFNKEVTELLKKLKNFIDQNSNLKTSDELLYISKEFSKKKKELYNILVELDENTMNAKISNNLLKKLKGKALKDYTNKKNIQSASKYNIILSRYVIETVLNSKYKKIMPLNLDNLDDYLSYHYSHDQMIILSTTIDENGNNSGFSLVKATGFLGSENAKMFGEYFPTKYAKVGEEKMFRTVSRNVNNLNGKFEFVIEKNRYMEHFRFDFELAKTIISDKVMLYGSYYSLYDNIIILKVNTNNNTIGIAAKEIEVVAYSKGATKLLLIPSYYIDLINQSKNYNLNLDNFFKHVKSKSSKDPTSEIHCNLAYDHLNKVFLLLEDCVNGKAIDDLSLNMETVHKDMEKMKKSFEKRIKKFVFVQLKKLFELTNLCYIYKINFQFAKHETREKKLKAFKQKGTNSSSEISDNEVKGTEDKQISLSQGEADFKNFNDFSSQNGSVAESSTKISSTSSISTLNKERNQATLLIKKETKKLTLVSQTIFALNGFLVVLCLIFLFVQIMQTSELKKVNTFYFDYKALRLYFSNLFASVMSTLCVCESVEGTKESGCSNLFLEYLDDLQETIEFHDYQIKEYMFYEIYAKIDQFKEYFSDFKKSIHDDSYKQFVTLLDIQIVFYYLQQERDSLSTLTMTITFEQELDLFISSMYTLINNNNGGSFFFEPFYFYTFQNGSFDLSNFKSNQVSNIQKEVFKLLSNYVYYAYSFNQGETLINKKSSQLKERNLVFSIVFMALLGIFNTAILIVNVQNLNIASYVFKKLICSLIFRIENPILKGYLLKKITSLIHISEMYTKDPSTLIQSIGVEQIIYNKQVLSKDKNFHHNSSSSKAEEEKDDEKKFIESVSKSSFHTKVFTNQVMIPLYKRNFVFFLGYYIIFITLDIALILIITNVFKYQEYVVCNYNLQISLYKSIAGIHLFRLINTTETDYGKCLNEEIRQTGIINGYIQDTFNYFWDFYIDQKQHNFIKIIDYYDNNCDKIYDQIDDSIYDSLTLPVTDKFLMHKKICKHFNFEAFDSMYFVFEEFLMTVQNLHNRYTKTSYADLYEFSNNEYLKRAYIYIYYFIRPIKQNFDINILTPLILSKFSFYVVCVWFYLLINIIMELILFVFNKVFIVKKLNDIHEYFFLFVQCTE